MGALLNDLLADGIWKYRVELDGAFPDEGERVKYEGHWIELREPDSEEAMALSDRQQDEILKLVGKCIVDHSFEISPGKRRATVTCTSC